MEITRIYMTLFFKNKLPLPFLPSLLQIPSPSLKHTHQEKSPINMQEYECYLWHSVTIHCVPPQCEGRVFFFLSAEHAFQAYYVYKQ